MLTAEADEVVRVIRAAFFPRALVVHREAIT
jgi:hypothetical protein